MNSQYFTNQYVSRWASAFVFGMIATFTAVSPLIAAEAKSEQKLNIVFILADDLGWGEVGCYGQKKIPTPNIDQLAKEGMRFTQHYSGAPVCAPARCVLMTGKHLGHAEVRTNRGMNLKNSKFDEGQQPLSPDAVTIAQIFQKAGYATGAMGKWGLGPVGSTGDPNKKGFDLFYGYNCQSVAHSYYPPHIWRNNKKIIINTNPIPGRQKQPEGEVRAADWIGETHAPHLIIAEAEKFVADNKDRPFFLYLPFIEPHVAIHPPQSALDKFPKEWDQEVYRGESGYLPHPRPRAGYAAMISDLDSYVGRIMKSLKDAGVADHTLVVFTSDNGATHEGPKGTRFHVGGADTDFFNSTANLRGYKGSVYEGGIRVPMIVRLPGKIKAGTVNDTPSYFPDWFPTLCDAAGLKTPDHLDGNNLWPVMTKGATLEHRKPMVWVFPSYGGQVAVRMGDMKVVRQKIRSKHPDPWEVYDLSKDPGEEHDLASSKPEVIARAKEILRNEVSENKIFPLPIPGVTTAAKSQ